MTMHDATQCSPHRAAISSPLLIAAAPRLDGELRWPGHRLRLCPSHRPPPRRVLQESEGSNAQIPEAGGGRSPTTTPPLLRRLRSRTPVQSRRPRKTSARQQLPRARCLGDPGFLAEAPLRPRGHRPRRQRLPCHQGSLARAPLCLRPPLRGLPAPGKGSSVARGPRRPCPPLRPRAAVLEAPPERLTLRPAPPVAERRAPAGCSTAHHSAASA
eukprot:6581120-Pyramimonas_sp.AAC.1